MKLTQEEILATCAEMGMDAWILERVRDYRDAKESLQSLRTGAWSESRVEAERGGSGRLRMGRLTLEPADCEHYAARLAFEGFHVTGWGESECSGKMAEWLEELAAELPGLIAKLKGGEG